MSKQKGLYIRVTEEHLRKGKPNTVCGSAIGLAIRDKLGNAQGMMIHGLTAVLGNKVYRMPFAALLLQLAGWNPQNAALQQHARPVTLNFQQLSVSEEDALIEENRIIDDWFESNTL